MTIVNTSDYPDSQVYAVVTGATITQANLVKQSLALSPNYPSTGAAHSYYFCQVSGNGRVWLSLGSPLLENFAGGQQPSPTSEPTRFGIVEFGPPGSGGSLDTSNVNDFDFALNQHTYAVPGGSSAAQSEVFSANTCQIDSLSLGPREPRLQPLRGGPHALHPGLHVPLQRALGPGRLQHEPAPQHAEQR